MTARWNELLYGPDPCPMTAAQIVRRLLAEGCVDDKDRVCRFPDWFGVPETITAEARGILRRKFYQHLWGHTEYFVNRAAFEAAEIGVPFAG